MFLEGYGCVIKEREANWVGFRELQELGNVGRVGTLEVTRSSQLALEGLQPGSFKGCGWSVLFRGPELPTAQTNELHLRRVGRVSHLFLFFGVSLINCITGL